VLEWSSQDAYTTGCNAQTFLQLVAETVVKLAAMCKRNFREI